MSGKKWKIGFAAVLEKDLDHLSGDLARAYAQLAGQWVGYMEHLQRQYPYLFSLAMRTNPLDPHAQASVD